MSVIRAVSAEHQLSGTAFAASVESGLGAPFIMTVRELVRFAAKTKAGVKIGREICSADKTGTKVMARQEHHQGPMQSKDPLSVQLA